MGFVIERTESMHETRVYSLNIDETYVERLNEWLDRALAGEHPIVTIEDIEDLYNLGNDKLSTEVGQIWWQWKDGEKVEVVHPAELEEVIRDYVSDDIWDCNYEVIDCDTYDVEDTIRKVRE